MTKKKAYDCTQNCEEHFDRGCCLLETFLVRVYLAKTFVDGLRDIFNYARWVVGIWSLHRAGCFLS